MVFWFLLSSTLMQAIWPNDWLRLNRGRYWKRLRGTGALTRAIASRLPAEARRTESLGLLGGCSHMAKKEFARSEMQNIIKYLNDQFYQFR
jgi:hypothetical protein